MAMLSGGGHGARSYSYTVRETHPVRETYTVRERYTLEQAIKKASCGDLDPLDVYRQMPAQMQNEADRITSQRYTKPFGLLFRPEQCEVMSALAAEVKRAKEEAEKPISILEALQLAAEGKIDDNKVYDALPEELRKPIEALTEALVSSEFKKATPEARRQVLKIVLQALAQQAGGDASQRGRELHHRATELKSKGDLVEAVNAMREADKVLTEQAHSNGGPSAESLTLYCSLSSARAHLGEWTGDIQVLRSAIAAADRGLEDVEKISERPEFNRGVLLHNRGHAGWRLGELTHDHATLSRGRQDIADAGNAFLALKLAEAVQENNALLANAERALAKL